MKLIVGLGNPGLLYIGSRHNIGFQVIKALAKAQKVVLKKESGIKALSVKTRIGSQELVLSTPFTYMNLSGGAVKALLQKYKVDLKDLLIVCDDLDLEFGRLRIRPLGGSAGHRGIKSIVDSLGTSDFSRLRIGIGRPKGRMSPAEFVLSRFNREEKKDLPDIISNVLDCIHCWTNEGIEKSMSMFNRSF